MSTLFMAMALVWHFDLSVGQIMGMEARDPTEGATRRLKATAALAATPEGAIPSELKTVLNQLSFLASMAHRCDLELSVKGRAGRDTEACRDFVERRRPVIEALRAQYERALDASRAAHRFGSRELQLEWDMFVSQWERDLASVGRAVEHLKFWRAPPR